VFSYRHCCVQLQPSLCSAAPIFICAASSIGQLLSLSMSLCAPVWFPPKALSSCMCTPLPCNVCCCSPAGSPPYPDTYGPPASPKYGEYSEGKYRWVEGF
jgi:hypothetical protein